MSRTRIEKKLRTAKKTWKKLTTTLHSKFHALNLSKSIHTLTRRLTSALQRSLRLLLPGSKSRRRLLSPKFHNRNQYLRQFDQRLHNNFAAILIDELYAEYPPPPIAETSRGKEATVEEEEEEETSVSSIEDAWKLVVASSPHLRPVDERAEEFIRKFRRDIVLEKEKSLLEFQQMLARSAA